MELVIRDWEIYVYPTVTEYYHNPCQYDMAWKNDGRSENPICQVCGNKLFP
jgi:hypothetical protein